MRVQLGITLLLLATLGCRQEGPAASVQAAGSGAPTVAQPKLPTVKLFIGTNELITEIARTPRQMGMGMMFRESMSENEAMIFVYPAPQRVSFYMRNTRVPLSCAYIDSAGIIREIYDMKPFDESSIPSESAEIRYCLEVLQGWFERHNVNVGAATGTQVGTLDQTFFRAR